MERKRAAERDIWIPLPKDLERRNKALGDVEFFLQTYFEDLFDEPFTDDRSEMLRSIIRAARYGGDQAIAGPRGEGKTTLAMCGALFLMFAGLTHFPVVIGKAQKKAEKELKEIVERLQQSELLKEDFPEVTMPLDFAGPSARKLVTVEGSSTNLAISPELFAFPKLTQKQLGWPEHIKPASNGQVMAAVGIDGPIRGTKHRGQRPTLAIIDDIEDREAAASDALIEKNEEIIEQDVSGMGRSSRRIPRVFLCTIQNRKCNAYIFTDPKKKASFRGKRYRKMIKPPDRMDLVEQYIEMRRTRADDDPDARVAYRFWKERKNEIESGCKISNLRSYDDKPHEDGDPIELSACMSYYNRVADVGEKAVATEIDNDPPETVGPQGSGITADIVASRINGLARLQLPANTIGVSAAIDLGKYRCHHGIIAWMPGGGGCFVDYGVKEVHGNEDVQEATKAQDMEASQPAIYRALLDWRDELLAKELVDATGVKRKLDFAFIDSSAYTDAAYEFCRQVGGVFHPCKGKSPYQPHKASSDGKLIAGEHQHAEYHAESGLWLYILDTDYWKGWVHERFMTPTFDLDNNLRKGALSFYQPEGNRRHISISQHIVAEEFVKEFKEGKGTKEWWHVKNDNNHWFDMAYMASAASECLKVKLVGHVDQTIAPRQVDPEKTKPRVVKSQYQHGGNRFMRRQGGWVRGARR